MEESQSEVMESPSMMTYILGAVVVVAVIAGAWYFRSKSANTSETTMEPTSNAPVAAVTPTPGPIKALACDQMYFNPRVGYSEYYLSADGGDFSTAKSVSCSFTASVNKQVVGTAQAESALMAAPARNGSTFHCSTNAVKLTPNVKTIVEVKLTDDENRSATCTANFTFPNP